MAVRIFRDQSFDERKVQIFERDQDFGTGNGGDASRQLRGLQIERQARAFNIAAPSIITETQAVLWYAPAVNHWVRRTVVTRVNKRTRENMSEELTAFHRKQ